MKIELTPYFFDAEGKPQKSVIVEVPGNMDVNEFRKIISNLLSVNCKRLEDNE
jgi:hypothetical protein